MAAMRTFSKAYGLAGLRVGYLLGPAELVRALGVRAQRVRRDRARPGGGAREPRRRRRAPARADRAERLRAGDDGGGPARPGPGAAAQHGQLPAGRPRLARARPGGQRGPARARVIVRPARAFGAPAALRVTSGWPRRTRASWPRPPRRWRRPGDARGARGRGARRRAPRRGPRDQPGRAPRAGGPAPSPPSSTPSTGRAWRVGITGAPGVGKSTLIGALVRLPARARQARSPW